jgi:hypothetical protein
MEPTIKQYVIFPDIGGHLHVFRNMLEYVGMDLTTLLIPEGMIIVQLGDLVHKGEKSLECLQLAYALKQTNGDKYIQLLGNHEAHYLGGSDLTGRAGVKHVGVEAVKLLIHMWSEGLIQAAYAASTVDGNVLFTHGGLTYATWVKSGADDAFETADRLNDAGRRIAKSLGTYIIAGRKVPLKNNEEPVSAAHGNNNLDFELLFKEGKLLTGIMVPDVGIIHPRTGSELAHGWLQEGTMPFSQIHGHETIKYWSGNDWHDDVPEYIKQLTIVDEVNCHTKLHVGDKYIWSVDPAYSVDKPTIVYPPLALKSRVEI